MKRLAVILGVVAVTLLSGACDTVTCTGEDCGDPGVSDVPLRTTKWQLVGFDGHRRAVREAQSTLTFQPDTTLFTGKAACNSFFGTFQLNDGGRIGLDVHGTTLVGCELNDYESALMMALEHAAAYEIEGDNLTFLDEEGKDILEFLAEYPSE